MTPSITQQIDYLSLGGDPLEKHLQLTLPPFVQLDAALRQLRYVEAYAKDLGSKSVVVEGLYIDRDYMEDHSIFYSKSLYPYPNSCRRIHFFSADEAVVRQRLAEIVGIGIQKGEEAYREACRRLSDEAYLGFTVIKPLLGSPVGRTVLRCFPEVPADPKDASRRDFSCTRVYTVHLMGAALTVRGLAFQQQDVGVSACATTAVWTALQKTRDHEDIAHVTPAHITSLASKYSLPFGRAMPSEGLSIDQMCQAVQAVGVSPNVFRADRFADTRGYLWSAIRSGLAPVLVLKHDDGHHAVTAVGMKVRTPHLPSTVMPDTDDITSDLIAFYVHDDRYGPYLKANLREKEGKASLEIPLRGKNSKAEVWSLTHVLVPMHPKIRLPLSGLRQAALQVAATVHQIREAIEGMLPPNFIKNPTVTFASWIMRAHKYLESLFLGSNDLDPARITEFNSRVVMARYLGVVHLSASYFDPIDLLLDTTGTSKNTHCLAVVALRSSAPLTRRMAVLLARTYGCPSIG